MSLTHQYSVRVADFGRAIPEFSPEIGESRWYVAYTNSRHEKKVETQVRERGIECFLPLYRSVRRWKDRQRQLYLPLFPGYVFVKIPLRARLSVLSIPGVVQFVNFSGKPAPVLNQEIEALREGLARSIRMHPHPYLTVGRRVRMRSGPMAGATGILERRKDQFRLVLSIDLLMRSVAVEVDECDVEPLV